MPKRRPHAHSPPRAPGWCAEISTTPAPWRPHWRVSPFAGRTLELAGDQPTPVAAAAAISEATGIPVRYEQLTDDEAAALGSEIAAARTNWRDGHRWHADIEALRVIHPGLRTFADWLAESGAAVLREHRVTAGLESVE